MKHLMKVSFFVQCKDICKIEDVTTLCYWFIHNKPSIHFEEEKTKRIVFSKATRLSKLNISYEYLIIKQYHTVEYLGYCLDSNPSGESMPKKFLKKVHAKVRFLH